MVVILYNNKKAGYYKSKDCSRNLTYKETRKCVDRERFDVIF